MKTKTQLLAGVVFIAGCILTAVLVLNPKPEPTVKLLPLPKGQPVNPLPVKPDLGPTLVESPRPAPAPESTPLPQPAKSLPQPRTIPVVAVEPQLTADPVVKEQWGRAALSLVGADSYAEDVWVATINDPDLSDHARQNLIEDLNEDGLSDPKNPTVDDLPLIVSRLQLIEDLAPDAMDEVNAAAFQEAYKDLLEMYSKLTQ